MGKTAERETPRYMTPVSIGLVYELNADGGKKLIATNLEKKLGSEITKEERRLLQSGVEWINFRDTVYHIRESYGLIDPTDGTPLLWVEYLRTASTLRSTEEEVIELRSHSKDI